MNGLYAISDEILTPYTTILDSLKKALDGGVKIFQLRDKNSVDIEIEKISIDILNLCHKYGAIFIIDDRVELVKKINADGLHIGKDDISLQEARNILGMDKIIGVSCYGDIEYAKKMESLGANYVAFGSFFSSKTKQKSSLVDKSILVEAKKMLNIPICAIGGITSINARELIENGANMVAVISDLWNSHDIKAKAKEYDELLQILNSYTTKR